MSVTETMEEEEEEEQQQQQPNLPNKVAEITEPAQQEYSWPVIRFDVPPVRTYHFAQQFRNSSNPNNFLKGVKWSPDGSCLLTSSEDNTLRKFTLPDSGSGDHVNACSSAGDEDSYTANLVLCEGESVYDYCWYPYMTVSAALHIRAYDVMDEITAAFSIAFNPTGTKVHSGRIFEIVTDADLKNLSQDNVINKSNVFLSYEAKCCKPTIFTFMIN